MPRNFSEGVQMPNKPCNILRNYYSRQHQTRMEGARQIANANRRKYDAEYREAWLPGYVVDGYNSFADPRASHCIYKQTRKYLKKNGVDKIFKYYTPLLNEFNGDLAGVRVAKGEEDGDDEDRPALEGKSQS
ncbi:hypothetical protein B0H14DRAFT_2659276 [Mycena olivaceomarginata]|nr:hypothetical protein B0H14DRAFT_2659276 [Mycena olivaceomarginata]